MPDIKGHMSVSDTLKSSGSENHSVYMQRAEAARAGSTPLWFSLTFWSLTQSNRVTHPPAKPKKPAPKPQQKPTKRVPTRDVNQLQVSIGARRTGHKAIP